MTVEEKLQHFYDITIEDATKERDQQLSAFQANLDRDFAAHKELKEKEATERAEEEKAALEKELNREFSLKQTEYRQQVADREAALREELFLEVQHRLEALKETPDYPAYLSRKIRESLTMAGKERMTVYLDPEDAGLIPKIAELTGVTPVLSKEAFGGGMRAVIHNRHILIDYSFASLLQETREHYTFV